MPDMDEIRAMVEGGMSVSGIADELGITPAYASKLVNALGLSGSVKRKTALSRMTEEDVVGAIEMYQEGAPVSQVVLRYGLNYNAFYRLLNDRGVELRDRSPEAKSAAKVRIDHAVELYQQGMKINDIEAETGVRQPVLHRELTLRGIPNRRKLRKTAFESGYVGPETDIGDDILLNNLTDRERNLLAMGFTREEIGTSKQDVNDLLRDVREGEGEGEGEERVEEEEREEG